MRRVAAKDWRAWLAHAFAVEDPTPLSEGELAFIEELAGAVARRRMTLPARLTLEASLPLTHLASQATAFLRPFLGAFANEERVKQLENLLARRDACERLIERLREREEGTLR